MLIDRWPAWVRWILFVPAALSMFWAVPVALMIGQWMADGTGPGMGWLYQGFSKFLAAVLPPAGVVLVAWRVAPRARLRVAWSATALLVGLHVLGLAVNIVAYAQGHSTGPDPLAWTLVALALGGIAAALALVTVMDMQARHDRA